MLFKNKIYKFLLSLAVTMAVFLPFGAVPVLAVSDVDFTLDIDEDEQYMAGEDFNLPIIIKTQTNNGYINLEILLTYNKDVFVPAFTDENGFSAKTTDAGLLISYDGTSASMPPNKRNKVTPINDKTVVKINFAVLTGAAEGSYKFELKINRVQRLDENNSVDDKVSISEAKPKLITVVAAEDTNAGLVNIAETPFTTTQVVQIPEDGASAGGVIAIIFGAIVLCSASFVAGFIVCQRKFGITEPFAIATIFQRGHAAPRRQYVGDGGDDFADESADDRYNDGFGRGSRGRTSSGAGSRFGLDRLSGDRASSKNELPRYEDFEVPSRRRDAYSDGEGLGAGRLANDDDDVVDSYFGKSADYNAGNVPKFYFEDTPSPDQDDGFPGEFIPRGYTPPRPVSRAMDMIENADDDPEAYSLLDKNRNSRSDDGYGGFDPAPNTSPYRRATDDGDNDEYVPRRRYR